MTSSICRRYPWLWMAAIAVTFFAADCLSLHTGDDLGYMFTDSAHHCGDGHRVSSLSDCIATQNSHYLTTNGRWAVHVVVMACLNLMPLWCFRALNATMFALLWLLTVRLAGGRRPHAAMCALAWAMLLICLPQPAITLFTLVSYAVNYLWTGVAAVGLLYATRRRRVSVWVCVLAFFTGSLQESYSVPLCAGFLAATLLRRMPWQYTACLIAGTAVCAFAPGNLAHAAQTGGLAHKLTALGTDLPWLIVCWGAMAWGGALLTNRKAAWRFTLRHVVMFTAIATSLLMATVTYTSPRQLTCPSLFTVILILDAVGKRATSRRLAVGGTVAALAFLIAVSAFRRPVYANWQSVVRRASAGYRVAYPEQLPTWDIPSTPFTRAFMPDPLANRGLVAIGDRYTEQGLRRLDAPQLLFILPAAPGSLRDSRVFRITPGVGRGLQSYSCGGAVYTISYNR